MLLLLASLAAPDIVGTKKSGPESARSIAATSLLAIVGRSEDLKLIQRSAKVATYHLADRDHFGAPYVPDVGDVVMTDDLVAWRVKTSSVASATGTRTEFQTISDGPRQATRILSEGKVVNSRGGLSRPLWNLDNPISSLKLMLDAPDLRLSGHAIVHQMPVSVLAATVQGRNVRLFISEDNHLPMKVETVVDYPAEIAWASRGDLTVKTEWQNWTMFRGLRLPYQTDTFINGEPAESVSVTGVDINPKIDPDTYRLTREEFSQATDRKAEDVDAIPLGRGDRSIKEIVPGIVQIPGNWYSTLVRQPDGVVVIDAPISNGYSRQVIEEAHRRFPGLPIKAVVSTTSYNWHTAGLREYAANGIPIYVLGRNAAFIRLLLTSPHTLHPDTLSRNKRKIKIISVVDKTSIGSGPNRIELIALRRSNSPMMLAYLPSHKILHTAESVQPLGPGGSLLFPESLLELKEEVAARHLVVARMIGMHMSPTPWSFLEETLLADQKGENPPKANFNKND